METVSMKMENRKTNKPHKFLLDLLQNLDLRKKHVAIKNLRKQYKHKKTV